MLKILRQYNKKILAVVGVFLMIAFIVPSVMKNPDSAGSDQVFGHIGKDPVLGRDLQRAGAEWTLLTQRLIAGDRNGGFSFADAYLRERLIGATGPDMIGMVRQMMRSQAMQIIRQIDATTYCLLLKEAERMKVQVSSQQAQEALAPFKSDRLDMTDPGIEAAAMHWLMILEAFARISDGARISPAAAMHMVADQEQQVQLKLVEFKADDFKKDVAAPTPQQLEAFFDKHRDSTPEADDYGFGYRYPNRVRVQYIKVMRDDVKAALGKRQGDYLADEDVVNAYMDPKNREVYQRMLPPATQPSTQPSTQQASTRPTTEPVAASQPAWREWDQLSDAEKNKVRDQVATQRAYAITSSILQVTKTQDWPPFRQALKESPSTLPANPPPTKVGVPYLSEPYLMKVSEYVQTELKKESRGVLPRATSERELMSAKQLAELPGIGKGRMRIGQYNAIPFADYATSLFEPFMQPAQRKQALENNIAPLALYQPSPIFEDEAGNFYVFRVVQAEPAHAAASLADLTQRVTDDYITYQACQKAKEAAEKFLADVKGKDFAEVAAAQKRPVIETESFSKRSGLKLEKYKLPAGAYGKFVDGAFGLFGERLKSGNQHPAGAIEIPRAQRVDAAMVQNAKPAQIAAEQSAFSEVQITRQGMESRLVIELAGRWFEPAGVANRLQYVPERGERGSSEPADAPAPMRGPLDDF